MESEKWLLLKEEGNVHVKEGRFSDAIEFYTKALQFEPTRPVLYSNRAIAELKLKMYADACQDVESAIKYAKINNNLVENSNMIKYQRLLSEAFMGMDRLSEALEACEKGLELDPNDVVLLARSSLARDLVSQIEQNMNPMKMSGFLPLKMSNIFKQGLKYLFKQSLY
jgi:tetratricopeptide (TPR) repeat protein